MWLYPPVAGFGILIRYVATNTNAAKSAVYVTSAVLFFNVSSLLVVCRCFLQVKLYLNFVTFKICIYIFFIEYSFANSPWIYRKSVKAANSLCLLLIYRYSQKVCWAAGLKRKNPLQEFPLQGGCSYRSYQGRKANHFFTSLFSAPAPICSFCLPSQFTLPSPSRTSPASNTPKARRKTFLSSHIKTSYSPSTTKS